MPHQITIRGKDVLIKRFTGCVISIPKHISDVIFGCYPMCCIIEYQYIYDKIILHLPSIDYW